MYGAKGDDFSVCGVVFSVCGGGFVDVCEGSDSCSAVCGARVRWVEA